MAEEFENFISDRLPGGPPPDPGRAPPPAPTDFWRVAPIMRSMKTRISSLEEYKRKANDTMLQMAKELREYWERTKPKVIEINKIIVECSYCGSVAEEGTCNYCGV